MNRLCSVLNFPICRIKDWNGNFIPFNMYEPYESFNRSEHRLEFQFTLLGRVTLSSIHFLCHSGPGINLERLAFNKVYLILHFSVVWHLKVKCCKPNFIFNRIWCYIFSFNQKGSVQETSFYCYCFSKWKNFVHTESSIEARLRIWNSLAPIWHERTLTFSFMA